MHGGLLMDKTEDSLVNIEALLGEILEVLEDIRHDTAYISDKKK